jgi:hypothetical protein
VNSAGWDTGSSIISRTFYNPCPGGRLLRVLLPERSVPFWGTGPCPKRGWPREICSRKPLPCSSIIPCSTGRNRGPRRKSCRRPDAPPPLVTPRYGHPPHPEEAGPSLERRLTSPDAFYPEFRPRRDPGPKPKGKTAESPLKYSLLPSKIQPTPYITVFPFPPKI